MLPPLNAYWYILVPPHSTTHMGVVPSSSEHDRKAATANTPSTNPLVSCAVRDLMKTIGHLRSCRIISHVYVGKLSSASAEYATLCKVQCIL